jgi:Rps23 Pro-64 3,4-dihydroxylase Tpa1-like proline 4-hydroxylase
MNKHQIAGIVLKKLQDNHSILKEDYHKFSQDIETKFFILDDIFPDNITKNIYEEFPKYKSQFKFRNTFREKKFTFAKLDKLPTKIISETIEAFHLKNIVQEISKITNILDLEPDPSLYGAGISRMDKTHFLNPHVDNSHDAKNQKYRRLNLLYYVTPDFNEEDGGNFELWDKNVKKNFKIQPKFNRLVVMEASRSAWHSVDSIKSYKKRCCLSNYYYSNNSPEEKNYYNVTSFTGRPNERFKRFFGKIDNNLRQTFANMTGFTRGSKSNKD